MYVCVSLLAKWWWPQEHIVTLVLLLRRAAVNEMRSEAFVEVEEMVFGRVLLHEAIRIRQTICEIGVCVGL